MGEAEPRAPVEGAAPFDGEPSPPGRPASAPGAARRTSREATREAELVLLPDLATFKALAAHALLGGPAKPRWGRQTSVYHDTDAADLRRSGLTLCLRRGRGRSVMILKARDGATEVAAPGDELAIELFPPEARALIARAAGRRPLRARFVVEVRRATRRLAFEGVMIEAAFEEGEIVAEARKTPVREIALSLKTGEAAGLYRLGLALVDVAPLALGVAGKAERGFALALGDVAGSLRAPALQFGAEATLDAATAALLRQSLAHFLGNWSALESADAAEAVHQIRVALRRLRSLLAILRRSFPATEIEFLRGESKRIADAFGEARDWRVFSDMVASGPARHLPGAAGLADLIVVADARSEAGRAHGAATLASVATTRFVLALQLYVAARSWRNAASQGELQALAEPAVLFAARALERAFRRLRKRARGFETLSPPARHEMRIALKRLRYAVEFFGGLFKPGSAVAAFASAASDLQDVLGAANDAAVASDLVARIDIADDSETRLRRRRGRRVEPARRARR